MKNLLNVNESFLMRLIMLQKDLYMEMQWLWKQSLAVIVMLIGFMTLNDHQQISNTTQLLA